MISSRKLVTLGISATLALAGMSASADDYRAEVRLSAERINPGGPADDIDSFGAAGTYYLEPVRTDGLPLAEAAFLGKSSYVDVGALRVDYGPGDADAFSANFGYYMPNTIFFGRLGVTHTDFGGNLGDDTNFNGSFGVTPFDGLLLTTDFDEDGWDPNVSAKYVGKLANAHYYALTAGAIDPDEGDTEAAVAFDYFLDTTFSVGAGFTTLDDRFSVRAEKFFTPSFAVGAKLYTGDDANGLGATVAWRF